HIGVPPHGSQNPPRPKSRRPRKANRNRVKSLCDLIEIYSADGLKPGGTAMKTKLAPGFHVAPGRAVDSSAYDQFTGRWSRLFVPLVLAAAGVQPGGRVLDVSTGTGEAARAIMPVIGASGHL